MWFFFVFFYRITLIISNFHCFSIAFVKFKLVSSLPENLFAVTL